MRPIVICKALAELNSEFARFCKVQPRSFARQVAFCSLCSTLCLPPLPSFSLASMPDSLLFTRNYVRYGVCRLQLPFDILRHSSLLMASSGQEHRHPHLYFLVSSQCTASSDQRIDLATSSRHNSTDILRCKFFLRLRSM